MMLLVHDRTGQDGLGGIVEMRCDEMRWWLKVEMSRLGV